MATYTSIIAVEQDQSIDRCAAFLIELARQAHRSPSPSLAPQSSNRVQRKRARIITLDEAIATRKRIRLSQPKPPQSLLQYESDSIIQSIEKPQYSNLPTPTRIRLTQSKPLQSILSQRESESVVQSTERPYYLMNATPRRRQLSRQPPRRPASVTLQRPYPNNDTPMRRRMIEYLSKGICVRLSSPTPGWAMSYEEAHQAGLEKGRRQDLEQKIEATPRDC
ncbi:hypothetical protein OEA41_006236 [Lepraria neglecta]|uniref:Uncharacterized protein n=1 Tax=Lepraria neglecta TaxID=209136 RepID=A0AAD9Z7B6_9LECA|nr:hypothetical protein OEA41_006236 [Lepraria neglecta]